MSKDNKTLNKQENGNDFIADVMPRFSKKDVIELLRKRDKDVFDNPYHRYEHNEINAAIEVIERLMPPSYFPNGA
jgi:hypothetical protein